MFVQSTRSLAHSGRGRERTLTDRADGPPAPGHTAGAHAAAAAVPWAAMLLDMMAYYRMYDGAKGLIADMKALNADIAPGSHCHMRLVAARLDEQVDALKLGDAVTVELVSVLTKQVQLAARHVGRGDAGVAAALPLAAAAVDVLDAHRPYYPLVAGAASPTVGELTAAATRVQQRVESLLNDLRDMDGAARAPAPPYATLLSWVAATTRVTLTADGTASCKSAVAETREGRRCMQRLAYAVANDVEADPCAVFELRQAMRMPSTAFVDALSAGDVPTAVAAVRLRNSEHAPRAVATIEAALARHVAEDAALMRGQLRGQVRMVVPWLAALVTALERSVPRPALLLSWHGTTLTAAGVAHQAAAAAMAEAAASAPSVVPAAGAAGAVNAPGAAASGTGRPAARASGPL